MEITHIGIALVSGAVGFYSVKKAIESFSKKAPAPQQDPKDDSIKTITIDSKTARAMIQKKQLGSNVRVKMDETKRKSLAVGNNDIIPQGWEQVSMAIAPAQTQQPKAVQPTEKLKGEFSMKFFGSQLMVGDRVIKGALPKKLHLLEITTQDQVFIDGVPQTLHISDLEELKRVIRSSQLVK